MLNVYAKTWEEFEISLKAHNKEILKKRDVKEHRRMIITGILAGLNMLTLYALIILVVYKFAGGLS